MVRCYGEPPYTIAVVHGGPGACGSLCGVAKELSKRTGTLEPIQSQSTIEGLVEELDGQLKEHAKRPIFLLGHSWGSWLCVLYASRHQEMARGLILVGSAPFEERYVPLIAKRRMNRLTKEEQEEFQRLVCKLEGTGNADGNRCMGSLQKLVEKADYVEKISSSYVNDLHTDGEMYAAVWEQAVQLRKDGMLIDALENIRCPICVIHGRQDPHPYQGVTEALNQRGILSASHILDRCGHSPFEERAAVDEFYEHVWSFCDCYP